MLPYAILFSAKGIIPVQMNGIVWKNVEYTGYFHSEKKLERIYLTINFRVEIACPLASIE